MTTVQAINFLRSSGLTEIQIATVIGALQTPYKNKLDEIWKVVHNPFDESYEDLFKDVMNILYRTD